VVKHASPFYEYPWGDASLLDATVGHGDATSLKLVGPGAAGASVGGSVYTEPVLPDTRYEVSVWVKTEAVQGEGPGLHFGKRRCFPLVTGTNDWQRIGFVCEPAPPLHTVPFGVSLSGAGTAWFDDFLIRPLKKGENPQPPVAPGPKPIANPDAAPDRLLAWNSQSDAKDAGRTLLDLSRHGNHGRLERTAAIAGEDGKRVIEVDGKTGYVTGGHLPFKPPQSFSIWVKPGDLENNWNVIATGGAWNRAWLLFLFYKQPPYSIDLRPWGRRMFTRGIVPRGAWTHIAVVDDGKTIGLYANGVRVKVEEIGGGSWAAIPGPLVLGSSIHYGEPKNGFKGRLADCAYWNRALTAAEVKALFEQGPR